MLTSSYSRPTPGMVLARVLMASVFVVMGGYRLYGITRGATLPNSTLVFSALELLLGVLLMSGWKLRFTAALAALLMVVDAVLSHPFWSAPAADQSAQLLHFMKNIGFIGGLLLLALSAGRARR